MNSELFQVMRAMTEEVIEICNLVEIEILCMFWIY